MKNQYKISVIIINYNSWDYLWVCLDSLYKTDNFDSLEIIVSDNHSIQDQSSKIKVKYPDVKFIQNRENLGFSAANNQAIKFATGKYILLLNPDTLVYPNTISAVSSYLDKDEDYAVGTCRVELKEGKLDDACHRGFPTPWNAFCYFSGLSGIFSHSIFLNGYHLGYRKMAEVHEIDSCVGAFMMIRKSVGDKLGWFDTDYFWYGEDLDFCYRIKTNGYKVLFIPQVRIVHHKGISSGIKKHTQESSSATLLIKRRATKSRFEVMRLFYKKHYLAKYPYPVMIFVLWSINFMEWYQLKRINKI